MCFPEIRVLMPIETRLGGRILRPSVTVVGLDDTDSRKRGMCTTYVADTVARRLVDRGWTVERLLLVRCNPAIEHKTRGNAALAIHTEAPPETALDVGERVIDDIAEAADERTNPGLVVAPGDPDGVSDRVAAFAREAIDGRHTRTDARRLVDRVGYDSLGWKNGRGVIGALAAAGAWRALDAEEWTYERIAYREPDRWGTERSVDPDSVFDAAEAFYPAVWDTVDREAGEIVCVPRTPGPILYGIRGDDPAACRAVAERIESEPVERARTFVTNQGTDGHLRDGTVAEARDGYAYRLDGTVSAAPETREGGHVFFELDGDEAAIDCVAFEPTKRFRDRVRRLRVGDRLTVCGEVSDGTVKLEKFAVRALTETERATPTCPSCGRTMESAGRGQGYRCRDCDTAAAGPAERPIERELDRGWHEVPPRARRHVAKPLVRGGFDAPTHPER
jgi:tRNA(Ile2)-agmatinylcytidine synthase